MPRPNERQKQAKIQRYFKKLGKSKKTWNSELATAL